MHTHQLDNHCSLPMTRSPDAEQRDCPSGTGVVLAVLAVLSVWALIAALGV